MSNVDGKGVCRLVLSSYVGLLGLGMSNMLRGSVPVQGRTGEHLERLYRLGGLQLS